MRYLEANSEDAKMGRLNLWQVTWYVRYVRKPPPGYKQ